MREIEEHIIVEIYEVIGVLLNGDAKYINNQ